MINKKQMIKSFNRAAMGYDQHAALQKTVADHLLQRLQWLKLAPKTIVDLGAGTGYGIKSLLAQYPQANIVAVDIAENMLDVCRQQYSYHKNCQYLCADMRSIPLAENSIDMIISSLAIHWEDDLLSCFSQIEKILSPGGVFLFSTLGVDTLKELRLSWQQVDTNIHVHSFFDMHDIGDVLMHVHLSDPVMDVEYITLMFNSVKSLARQLQGLGTHNVHRDRTRGLTSRSRWNGLENAYEQFREASGLPATYEVIYGIAWKPRIQRTRASDVAEVRLDQIRRRR